MEGLEPRRRPLRIAFVTSSLGLGGSERQMLLLAQNLPKDRFQVEFVLLGRPGPLSDEARRAGAVIHALYGPPRASAPPAVWALRVLVAIARFVRVVRRRRFDVVDAWLFGSTALVGVTRPLTRVPVFVSGRRSLSDFKAGFTLPQRMADAIARWSADAIVANADAVAEDVRTREGLRNGRLRVIRNGVEIPEPMSAAERRRVRRSWGVRDDGVVVVGCVANYKRGKGLELLVDAFADVAAASQPEGPDMRLVLVGDGPLRPALQDRIRRLKLEDRVVLVGALPNPRPLNEAFDMAVLASETEGLPNVLLEAAAAGRPLVATDAGASREVVRDGISGLLVPIGDREALAAAIGRLAADQPLRETLGAAARDVAISDFGVDRSVAAFASLYEELAAKRGRRRRPGREDRGRPRRVLYIGSDLSPGGSELQMLTLARRLPRERYQPTFVLLRKERGLHADSAEAEGMPVHVLGVEPRAKTGWPRFLAASARALVTFLAIARRGRFDVADAWLFRSYWLASLTRPLTGIPVVISGRRSLSDFKDRWRWPARMLDRLARSASDAIVANSEAVRQDVIRREGADPAKVIVIRNGVETVEPPTSEARAALRAGWQVDPEDFVIGCVANLRPRKGIEHLLRAFALLAKARPSARLVLLGDGPLRGALEHLSAQLGVDDRVRFIGRVPRAAELMAGFDLYVHPSESEGLPNAVLEAAAHGLAIVATPVGGTVEIVVDGETGLLVPVGDEAALADAMGRLMDEPELRARLGLAARDHVLLEFGMDRFVAETTGLYDDLAGRRIRRVP